MTDPRAHDPTRTGQGEHGRIVVDGVRERYLLVRVSFKASSHRHDSLVFACYATPHDALSSAKAIQRDATPAAVRAAMRAALVAVVDPGIGMGTDRDGVDLVGDAGALPAIVREALDAPDPYGTGRYVSPLALDDVAVHALDHQFTVRLMPGERRHPEFFLATLGPVPLAYVDPNGMGRQAAVDALLRDRTLPLPAGLDFDEARDAMRAVAAPVDVRPRDTVTAVPVPKDGEPPSGRTVARYHDLLRSLGSSATDFPLPATDAEAKGLNADLKRRYVEAMGTETMPATERQSAYAKSLAYGLGIAYPFAGRFAPRDEVSDFIDACKDRSILSDPATKPLPPPYGKAPDPGVASA